jgi:hypothetical protein
MLPRFMPFRHGRGTRYHGAKPNLSLFETTSIFIFGRLRLFASRVHRINIPVDLKMFIVDKKQNQWRIRRCSVRFLREKMIGQTTLAHPFGRG